MQSASHAGSAHSGSTKNTHLLGSETMSSCGESSAAGALSQPALSQAEADRMQREADSYVQVITAGEEPFQIVWASEAWLRLCEYTPAQVLGHTLELMQGPMTERGAVASLMNAIRRGEPITLSMINHTRTGKPFSHTLRVEPLRDSRGHVQCFQATSSNVDETVGRQGAATHQQPASRTVSDALLADAMMSSSPTDEHGDGVGELSSSMKRTGSMMSISGMLPRTGSELQISEMLDLFDQQQNGPSPKQVPTSAPMPPTAEMLPAQVGGVGDAVASEAAVASETPC